ncbi:MAG: formate C-acetyltransferase [Gammaproteobacteria bacterium]|nr:formate C-acetyltransferase [Gammaproteobacteria bacterium]
MNTVQPVSPAMVDALRAAAPPASARIQQLRAGTVVDSYPLCIEKVCLVTESFQRTCGEPQILRRARALANVLARISIFIDDGELIVGNAASKPMGVELDCDYGIWSSEEIAALKREGFSLSAEDEARLQQVNEFWSESTLVARSGALYDEERMWPFMQSGVVLAPWKSRRFGSGGGYAQGGMGLGPGFMLCGFEIERVLQHGLNAIIAEAERELAQLRLTTTEAFEKAYFLQAVIIAHRAIIGFAGRFAELASRLASAQRDPARRRELERIAATCRRVPAEPARSFHEALQSFWFMFLMFVPSPTAAAGRFDQYMYPFYRADIDAGATSDEEVLELLQCLRIKDMQINRTSGALNRQRSSGLAKWHNWTIGGVTPDGRDATNDLSYLLLEAARRCPTPHHTLTVRVHDGTPESLMVKALEVVKTGIGLPAFIGDKAYIGYLDSNGVPLEQARDYIVTGCLDVNIPGRSRTMTVGFFVVPLVFEIFMRNGIEPRTGRQLGLASGRPEDFTTYEEFYAAFCRQLVHFMELAAERNNIDMKVCSELFPDPVRSSLMHDALRVGKDLLQRTLPFENGAVMNPVGMINVADSLAAVKQLVYEDRSVTMAELCAALAADWQGPGHERIRQLCLAAPKYGNGNRAVDEIAAELYRFWAEITVKFPTWLGGTHKPTAISITSHAPGGALTGATPDGRRAGECLADGTVSPMRGRDTHGPTAVIRSAAAIEQEPYQATLMNMKFHPSAMKSEGDLRKLSMLIRTYFSMGGKHIQFNVVTRETLLAAQANPEQHRDLVVRMAGYSAYFVQLSRMVQDEIIGRMEHARI